MGLAVVRSIRSPSRLSSAQEIEDFEQELVDQYALACAASGVTDRYVSAQRGVLFKFIRLLGRPVREAQEEDADRTGSRHQPASLRRIWLTCGPGLSAAAVREDRILDEAHATSSDVRRIADLFGPSIQAGTRNTNTIEHLDLTVGAEQNGRRKPGLR